LKKSGLRKPQESQKMPGPAGLWVQEKPRPGSRLEPISSLNPSLAR